MRTMVKLNKLSLELLPRPSYSPDLALTGKRFGSNEEKDNNKFVV